MIKARNRPVGGAILPKSKKYWRSAGYQAKSTDRLITGMCATLIVGTSMALLVVFARFHPEALTPVPRVPPESAPPPFLAPEHRLHVRELETAGVIDMTTGQRHRLDGDYLNDRGYHRGE